MSGELFESTSTLGDGRNRTGDTGQCPGKFTFKSPCTKNNARSLCTTSGKVGGRQTYLLGLIRIENDARVALTVGLDENIHDGLIDTLRKVYKQLSNPHEKAVVTGGMHTAASTRWGGTQEIVDEAGNMCCPDGGQAQHPTLEHVLWNCDRYAHLRVHSPPSCPLVRRLGWSHETTVSQSLSLLRQMGKIREAEVINRMQRVRLQHARVIRVVAQPSCLVILRSRLVILRSLPALALALASGIGAGACACSGCGRCCGLPTPGANAAACGCRLAQAE